MNTHKENFRLDDHEISRIGWISEPDFFAISVGIDGVTRINGVEQFLGDYSIFWIQVWKGNKVVVRYNARNIDTIEYKEFEHE